MSITNFQIGDFYHVNNRGNGKQNLFFERENYIFFLKRLSLCLKRYGPSLACYCLIPNHFHFCMREDTENGITKTLLSFQTSYAKAVNKRYGLIGHLFQDTFKHARVDRDEYLLHLSRYIHLNPVKAGLVRNPEDWIFSSYRDYVGLRNGRLPKSQVVLSQFSERNTYRDFVD